MIYLLCTADWGPISDSTIKDIIYDEVLWPSRPYATLEEAIKGVQDQLNEDIAYKEEDCDVSSTPVILSIDDFEWESTSHPFYIYKGYYEAKFDNGDEGLYVRIWEMPNVNLTAVAVDPETPDAYPEEQAEAQAEAR